MENDSNILQRKAIEVQLFMWGCEMWPDATVQVISVSFFFSVPALDSSSSQMSIWGWKFCVSVWYTTFSLFDEVLKKKKMYSFQNRLGSLRVVLSNVWYFICYPIFTFIHVHCLLKAYLFFLAIFFFSRNIVIKMRTLHMIILCLD